MVGGLALAGIFPWAGFLSKDEILLALKSAAHAAGETGWGWVYGLVYWVAILTAFMTAFYTGRAFFMTFWGPEKLPSPDDPEAPAPEPASGHGDHEPHAAGQDETHGHHDVGHESPPIMTYPLMVLAGLCGGGGPDLRARHTGSSITSRGRSASKRSGTASTGSTWRRPWSARSPACSASAWPTGCTPSPARSPAGSPSRSGRSTRRRSTSSMSMRCTTGWWSRRPGRWRSSASSSTSTWWTAWCAGSPGCPASSAKDMLAGYQNGLIQFYAAVSALGVAVLLWVLLVFFPGS